MRSVWAWHPHNDVLSTRLRIGLCIVSVLLYCSNKRAGEGMTEGSLITSVWANTRIDQKDGGGVEQYDPMTWG